MVTTNSSLSAERILPKENSTSKLPEIGENNTVDFLLEEEKNNENNDVRVSVEDGFIDDAVTKMRNLLRSNKQKPVIMPKVRDDITIKIEKIMEADLGDAYRALTPLQQQEFKLKGEETAVQIRKIMEKTKIKVKKIFALLVAWLRFLPGIDRFFLEQEAKIKTDQIIALSKHSKKF
jgi:hypothetical protein